LTTREEVYKESPAQDLPFVRLPSKLVEQMGLIKRFEMIFTAEDLEKADPYYRNEWSLIEVVFSGC
jgi:hypothetical protein